MTLYIYIYMHVNARDKVSYSLSIFGDLCHRYGMHREYMYIYWCVLIDLCKQFEYSCQAEVHSLRTEYSGYYLILYLQFH